MPLKIMKLSCPFFAAALAACFMTGVAVAADASPVGTWAHLSYDSSGTVVESILVIENVDGKLNGTLRRDQIPPLRFDPVDDTNSYGGRLPLPGIKSTVETIRDVTFEAGGIAFKTERTANSRAIVTTFAGKLEGKLIKGTSTTTFGPDRNGRTPKPIQITWTMKRAK